MMDIKLILLQSCNIFQEIKKQVNNFIIGEDNADKN